MTASLNEVQTLAMKAARGAGLEPAAAAHFGRAALFHLLSGRDPEGLRQALHDGRAQELPLRLGAVVEAGSGTLDDAGDLTRSYVEALPFSAALDPGGAIMVDLTKPAPKPHASRCTLPSALKQEWQGLAAKTFVPETEASRLSGAGAGLTDND